MKKLSFIFVLLFTAFPLCLSAETLKGDVNNDGSISIADVTTLINHLLSGDFDDSNSFSSANADVYEDDILSIRDVTALINILLALQGEEHEFVDLGLSSGTLWATCNIGASEPNERGDYFAWGETAPKSKYDASTYHGGSPTNLENDAAYVNWGTKWRMPTYGQLYELKTECTWSCGSFKGTNGCWVTGPNGNSMFLPAAGGRSGTSSSYGGVEGWYWSTRDHFVGSSYDAWYLAFKAISSSHYVNMTYASRSYGLTIRAVRARGN